MRAIEYVKAVAARVYHAFFSRRKASLPPDDDLPEAVPIKPRAPRKAPDQMGAGGALYYLDDILDRLADYEASIRMLRKADRSAYDLYSRVGGRIISRSSLFDRGELHAYWTAPDRLPTFGAVHMWSDAHGKGKGDKIGPIFLYFTKITKHILKLVHRGDIYSVVVVYRDYENDRIATGEFFIGFTKDGGIKALKTKDHRYGAWGYPRVLHLLKECDPGEERLAETPAEIGCSLFKMVANMTITAASGIQVRAERNGVCSMFDIEIKRSAYFFKDRDKTITVDGKTRRIFHFARPHERKLPDGRVTYVRAHFRGERHFNWKGYAIDVSMPGLHHSALADLTGPAIDAPDDEPMAPGMITMADVGDMVAVHMSAAPKH